MHKGIKISLNVLSGIVLSVAGLLVGVMLLLDVGFVQNALAGRASRFASDYLGTTVSVGAINLTGYNRLTLRDFYVEDYQGDTVIYAQTASARVGLAALMQGGIVIGAVRADSAKVFIHDTGEGKVNIAEIVDRIKTTKKSDNPSRIELHDLVLTNSQFRFLNDQRPEVPDGVIDWGNMVFTQLNAKARELIIVGARIEMELHEVNLRDKSGAVFSDLNVGRFVIDPGLLEFTDCHIRMPRTDLNVPLIRIASTENWKQWKGFVDSVRFDIRIENSRVGAQDLKFFVPFLNEKQTFVLENVTATYQGIVNDFGGQVKNALVYGTRFEGQYHVEDVVRKPLRFDGTITRLTTSAGDIRLLAEQFGIEIKGTPAGMLARTGLVSLTAEAGGKLADFQVHSNVATDLGHVVATVEVGIAEGRLALRGATAASDGFDVGYLTSVKKLGRVKFAASGDLHNYTADIAELNYNGYAYHGIAATGSFDGDVIRATVVSADSAAQFTLDGSYASGGIPRYEATLNAARIDLNATNFNKKDEVSLLAAKVVASGSGVTLDDLVATAKIYDIRYIYGAADSVSVYKTSAVTVAASNSPSEHRLVLMSEPLTAEYSSAADYRSSFGYLTDIIYVFLPALPKSEGEKKEPDMDAVAPAFDAPSYINIKVADVNPLLQAVVPGLSIAPKTNVVLNYDPSRRNLVMQASSDFVEWNEAKKEPMYITRFRMDGRSTGREDSLHLNITTGEALVEGVNITAARVAVMALDNHADISIRASSEQMSIETDLNGVVDLGRNAEGELTIRGRIEPSTVMMDGVMWGLNMEHIDVLPDRLSIDRLQAKSLSGHFYVDGALSNNDGDTLKLDVTNLELAPIVRLLKVDGLTVDGTLNGKVGVSSLTGGTLSQADMRVDGMRVNGCEVVPLVIRMRADAKLKQTRLTVTNQDGSREYARGYLRSDNGEYMVLGAVRGIPVEVAKPFMGTALVNPQGELDVEYDVTSQNKKPVISGTVAMRGMAVGVAFNNVTYSIEKAVIAVKNNIATLPATVVGDNEGHTARLTAGADFRNFSAVSYSAQLQADNLAVLNTTYAQNTTLYGKLAVTGRVDMSGDANGMNLNVVAETNSGAFHLPMTGSRSVVNSDFVTFESRKPLIEAETVLSRPSSWREKNSEGDATARPPANINVAMTLTVRPNTEVSLVLDPSTNDGIRARGDAVLNLRLAPRNDLFTLNGTYEISDGEYTLNLQGITSRTFTIQQGSTIRWSGEPLDPRLNITAVYSLRTSLSPLENIIGTGKNYGRVPVDCIVNIGDNLSHPTIAPDIRVRLSDPQTQTNIAGALATQDVKLTQFAWLVAFGEFFTGGNVTNEAVNLTDVGLSTAAAAGSGLITGELNKLIPARDGLSVNFDYHPSSELTSNEIVFGFTKKLTEKLTLQINGDYDTGDNQQAVNVRAGALIPDVALTWNISSHFNGRLFYRPIEQWDNINKGTGEFGAGISYRTDFNTFKNLFKKKIKK